MTKRQAKKILDAYSFPGAPYTPAQRLVALRGELRRLRRRKRVGAWVQICVVDERRRD